MVRGGTIVDGFLGASIWYVMIMATRFVVLKAAYVHGVNVTTTDHNVDPRQLPIPLRMKVPFWKPGTGWRILLYIAIGIATVSSLGWCVSETNR